jgi:acetyl-CoA acetyltransferase family protein
MSPGADAVVLDAVRSPLGKGSPDGLLSSLHPVELLAQTLSGLLTRTGIDPAEVEDVITGCVCRVGEQASTIGRTAWLAAGLPQHVPSTTVERGSGSSQQAVHFAAQGVMAGVYDVVIAAGIESMSHVPTGSSLLGRDPYGPTVTRRYAPGSTSQGVAADLMAQRWDIDRATMDAYAIRSHQRAAAVSAAGEFQREIVPIAVPGSGHAVTVIDDENICAASSLMDIGTMPPSHVDPDSRTRHPDVDWAVTAGNSAPAADGASAMLIVSERRARQLNVRPRARFRSFVAVADDPDFVLPGPITATELVLKRSGMDIDQIDHFEINETFAAVPLAWRSAVGANPEFLNPRGGAIALGHPRGASGLRLMTTMLSALEDTGGRFGLQASWEAGGEANATILERI